MASASPDVTGDELLDALAERPVLIERPFVVTDRGIWWARPIDTAREIQ